jgi:hypothetical protein
MATNSENPVPIRNHYSHNSASLPDHVTDLQKQAENPQSPQEGSGEKAVPMQGVIFDRNHYDLFTEALQDPNHPLRQAAEQAMRGFARAAEKPKGMSIRSASRELNVPHAFLWRWARQFGIIPILAEGSGSGSNTIIDREKAQEAAEFYREGKQQHVQPIKLYQRKYPDQFRGSSKK